MPFFIAFIAFFSSACWKLINGKKAELEEELFESAICLWTEQLR